MEGIILHEYTDKKYCRLLVINEDGSREIFAPSSSGFTKVQDIPAPPSLADVSSAIVAHAALPNAHHPANVGITGSKTIGGFKFTFTNGLLTGFEPV